MADKDYSKRELDTRFKNSEEKNDAWSATILRAIEDGNRVHQNSLEDMRKHEIQPILVQTTLTNGRVGALEKRADKHDLWRSWLTGTAFVLAPISVWLFYQWITIDQQIQAQVEERFDRYEVSDQITK